MLQREGKGSEGKEVPTCAQVLHPGAGRRQTLLVKCCSLQQGWALGKLARMQARRGHRSQAFLTSTCPAMLLGGIAGKGGLGTPPSATGHLPSTHKATPNQHCGTALLTGEGSGPREFIDVVSPA